MIIFFFIAFLIIGMVLLQESKGGGIAAMSGAQMDNVMGVRNPLRRGTAYCSIIFVLLALCINWYHARQKVTIVPDEIKIEKPAETVAPVPQAMPVAPAAPTPEVPVAPAPVEGKAVAPTEAPVPVAPQPIPGKTETGDKPVDETNNPGGEADKPAGN